MRDRKRNTLFITTNERDLKRNMSAEQIVEEEEDTHRFSIT